MTAVNEHGQERTLGSSLLCVMALAIICALAPWVWYFGLVAMALLLGAGIRTVLGFSAVFLVPSILVLGAAFLYGLGARQAVRVTALVGSYILSIVLQVLICLLLVLADAVPEAYKLVGVVIEQVAFTPVILGAVWVGSSARRGR